ncbi:Protein of unknown function [Succiniclasticum ruminis]|uniref:DUF721 domain-containing protein n=1 Tax=Succiniclasticum ruminis TaxID=40841 RepID=A0A1G6K1T1_9FIRM|nr:DUF721 domain-containing protein [Succiniclasticum ruminis]SDC24848.1 Protein of unknown function [Succiniclasticum ruminis]
MEDVEKTVLKMIGSQANQNQYSLFKMKACWKEIIGNNNAKHCGPVKLERRILTLQVDSSVWANQFLYYKNQFIQQINTFIGTDYVKDIKFTQGKNFKKGFKNKGEKTDIRETKLPIPPATEEEKKGLQLKFSHIADDKIRNAIIGVEETKLGLEKLYREGVIKKCPVCGSFLKNNETICYACEIKMKQELEYKLWSHILKEPWIKWYDLQKAVKCSETDFTMIKNDIKNYYFEKIRTKTADSQEIKLGIQLKAEKPLALISEKEYENILKFLQKGK